MNSSFWGMVAITRTARYLAIILTFLSVSANAENALPAWTTDMALDSGYKVRLHWTAVYEGYETVYEIELLEDSKPLKFLKVEGQPILNEDKTLAAFPNCWHGGCETVIRIMDLEAFRELDPILLDREAFLKCSFEGEDLVVILGAMHPGGKTETRIFKIR